MPRATAARAGANLAPPDFSDCEGRPMAADLNVLGTPLQPCSVAPVTGWFRDGCCRADPADRGLHTVCIVATEEFLGFSFACGNDLITPQPDFDFPGLKPGDRWCLCAPRWAEALAAGAAPRVVLESTHLNTLGVVTLEALRSHAVGVDRTASEQD